MANETAPDVNPSDLCITCGLCCNGTLFNYADMKSNEIEQVVRLGMKPLGEPTPDSFSLPCPNLDGTMCSCYHDRPAVCGDFMCSLVDALQDGEIDMATSLQVVARTREISGELREQLVELTGGGPELSIYELTVLLSEQMKVVDDPAAFRRENGSILLGLASLHLTLRKYFFPEDEEDGRALWAVPGAAPAEAR